MSVKSVQYECLQPSFCTFQCSYRNIRQMGLYICSTFCLGYAEFEPGLMVSRDMTDFPDMSGVLQNRYDRNDFGDHCGLDVNQAFKY